MITLKELLPLFSDKEIINRLIKLIPHQKKNGVEYKRALNELRKLSSKEVKDIQIYIRKEYDTFDKKSYICTSGIDKDNKTWAIEFTPFEEWLGMIIHRKTLNNFSKLDIIAHCLFEMTWFGFTNKDVKKEAKNLFKRVKSGGSSKCLKN